MALSPELYQQAADEAVANGVDPRLVFNVIDAESSGNHYDRNGNVLTSPTGARGLMQLEPGTARDMGVNADDPNDNIRGGVRYLATLQDKYGADRPHLIAAAYNGGPRHVDQGTVSPAARAYAEKVTQGLGSGGDSDVDPAFAGIGGSAPADAPVRSAGGDTPQYDPKTDIDPAFAGIGGGSGAGSPSKTVMGDGQILDSVTHQAVPLGAQNVAQALGVRAYKSGDPNTPDYGSRDMPYYAKPGQSTDGVAEGTYVIVPSEDGSSGQLMVKKNGQMVVEKSFGQGVLQGAMKPVANEIRLANTVTGGRLPMLNRLDQQANAFDARNEQNAAQGVKVPNGVGQFVGGAGMAGLDAALIATGAGALPGVAGAARALPALAPYADAAAQGAAAGGLLTDKKDPAGVLGDMAFGAAGGAATHGALNGVAGFIAPRLSAAAQRMRDAGVYLTPGGTLGGAARATEDKLASRPLFFMGDSIQAGQRASVESFNQGTGNQVLAPIGGRVTPGTHAGHDLIGDVESQISGEYDRILPHAAINVNSPQVMNDLAAVEHDELLGVPSSVKAQFRSIVFDGLANRADAAGNMPGRLFKDYDGVLGSKARQYVGSTDGDQQALGHALQAAQGAFRQALSDQNPAVAPQLAAANQSWAMFTRMRDAAARQGSDAGVFTPSQLKSATRAADKSAGKGAFARGDALLQDWSDAATNTVGNTYPDSGTAGRSMMNLTSVLGAGIGAHELTGHALPVLAGGAAVGGTVAGAYGTPAGRAATTWLMGAKFGDTGAALARGLRNLPPGVLASIYPSLRNVGSGQQPLPAKPPMPKRP